MKIGAVVLLLALSWARADESVSSLYLACLTNFEPYAESVWHEATFPGAPADSGYFGDGNSTGNGGIRGSCGIAVAYAVLVKAFPDDPRNPVRLERIRKAINYAARTHRSGSTNYLCVNQKRWGHLPGHGQTGMWAGSMGLACVLAQFHLPPETIADCQRAVADESDYQASIPPASGFVGDTQAEENGWNSNVPTLAAAWMPGHAHASTWLTAAKKYMANTYTVAQTNGDPLASWITTVTLYPSYGVENHGFYHPSYQLDPAASLGDSLVMAYAANSPIAGQLRTFAEHNVLKVWEHLSHVLLDSGELAYPSGLDWSLHTYEHNTYFAFLATHFDDPLARWTEGRMAALLRYRQRINGDGRFVGDSLENGFYHEAVDARHAAICWLHHQYGAHKDGAIARPEPFVAHYPDVKLLYQRSAAGFCSISYGPKIMGLVVPPAKSFPTDVYTTTPRLPGLIGIGALGNPRSARLLQLQTNSEGFEARFELACGSNGTNLLFIKSVGDALALVEAPQPSAMILETNAASFSIGIENHALTGGSRLVSSENGTSNVVERSGVSLALKGPWVCVSENLGMIAGPEGEFHYDAASRYNRKGAAEDTLEFVPRHALAPHFAVYLPGATAKATAAAAAQVKWSGSEKTSSVLTFPGQSGKLFQLKVDLPTQR